MGQYISEFLAAQHYRFNTERAYRYRMLALSRHEDEVDISLHKMTPDQLTDAFRRLSGNPRLIQAQWRNALCYIVSTYLVGRYPSGDGAILIKWLPWVRFPPSRPFFIEQKDYLVLGGE